MSHYEERLATDRRAIDARILAVGERVGAAHEAALRALLARDHELAYRTVLEDHPVNREVRAIEAACHAFVARHLPSAGHLRWVSSALRLCVALERIGDYASTICRAAVQLEQDVPPTIARDLELMGDQSRRVLAQALRAWGEQSADLARGTVGMAGQAEGASGKVFGDLLRVGEKERARAERRVALSDLFALLVIFNRLDRVVAQAKNVCEETLFAAAGETKPAKTYRLLFVDAGDDSWSQLAAAYGSKAFGDIARFEHAGWQPAEAIDPRCLVFMERHGLDGSGLAPHSLRTEPSSAGRVELDDAHVVVSLGGDLRAHVDSIPFHTVLLEWNVGPVLAGLDQERAESLLDLGFRMLQSRITELLETLRGGLE
ncbi:MAG: PhoU domain-containing protein [Acidobacteriota bacterium]